jgi:carbonic anhydrase
MSKSINPDFQPGFDDLWRANEDYAKNFKYSELTGRAARGLAIVTSVVGMKSGDAKILRNAGARVTQDVLRTLVLATYLLGVDRILVMPHTDCRMAQEDEEVIHAMIEEKHGVDTRSLEFNTVVDQRAALSQDLARIRAFPLIPKNVIVSGGIYHVATGKIEPIEN